jgi:hypothetical protein
LVDVVLRSMSEIFAPRDSPTGRPLVATKTRLRALLLQVLLQVHFSVDGTLSEVRASPKSFVNQGLRAERPAPEEERRSLRLAQNDGRCAQGRPHKGGTDKALLRFAAYHLTRAESADHCALAAPGAGDARFGPPRCPKADFLIKRGGKKENYEFLTILLGLPGCYEDFERERLLVWYLSNTN